MKKEKITGYALLGLLIGAPCAAPAQVLLNGGFETASATNAQINYNGQTMNGWSTTGYNFLFAGTPTVGYTGATTGADSVGGAGESGNVKLWGPGSGSANGLTASPAGGNFVGNDGAYRVAPLTQTVTGLVVGQKFRVGFWWAGAQQTGYDGITTDQWTVQLGTAAAQSTSVISVASHGFSGWQYQQFDFVANATSASLSFLAAGTPSGLPPFALLDGVTIKPVPEPTILVSLIAGVFGCGLVMRRRKRAVKSTQIGA